MCKIRLERVHFFCGYKKRQVTFWGLGWTQTLRQGVREDGLNYYGDRFQALAQCTSKWLVSQILRDHPPPDYTDLSLHNKIRSVQVSRGQAVITIMSPRLCNVAE